MPVQTTYPARLDPAFAGQQGDTDNARVISRTVTIGALAFGAVAVQGATDRTVRPPDASNTDFVGIAVMDQAQATPQPDQYAVGSDAALIRTGPVWVTVGEAVSVGAPAFFVPATGAIVTTATGNIVIPASRFDTSAQSGGLALLYLG